MSTLIFLAGPFVAAVRSFAEEENAGITWAAPTSSMPPSCQKGNSDQISELMAAVRLRPTASSYDALGALFGRRKNFACAVFAFRRALQQEPKSWELQYNLALALIGNRQPKEAKRYLQLVIQQKPNSFKAHNAMGLALRSAGDLDAAAHEFKTALQLNPGYVYAASNLAKALNTQKKYAAEIFYLRQALASNPAPAMVCKLQAALGIAYYQDDDRVAAIRTLKKVTLSHPKCVEAHYALGNAYAHQLKFKAAAREYRETLRLDSDNNIARLSLGKALLDFDNNKTTVLPELQEYVRRSPNDYEGRLVLGQAYQRFGELGKALGELRVAVRLNPKSYHARFLLGSTLAQLGKTDEAIRQLKVAQKLNPSAPDPLYKLYRVFSTTGDRQRAAEEFRAFQEVKQRAERKREAKTLRDNADYLLARKEAAKAAADYRKAIKLDPKNPNNAKTYYDLSLALDQMSKWEEERRDLEIAAKLDPNLAQVHNRLGALDMAEGKLVEAQQEFNIAIAANPSYWKAQNNLAVLLVRQQKYSESEKLLRHVTQEAPEYVDAYINLGLILATEGKYAEGVKQLKNAIRISPDNRRASAALRMVRAQLIVQKNKK